MDVLRLLATEDRDAIERWCQSRTQSVYLGNNIAVCRVLGKYRMFVDTNDRATVPHFLLDGCYETWVTLAIARCVRPGMRCVDVGAHLGYHTLLLADLVGPQGHVQAWEPQRHHAALLFDSVRLNGLGSGRTSVLLGAAGREQG